MSVTTISPAGHLAPEVEVLPNGGVVLLSKPSIRDSRIVLARTKRDFVTWHVYVSERKINELDVIVCEAGHYHGGGMGGLEAALADYRTRR